MKKNNLCFLFLALAVAFNLMPLLTQSVSAAEQPKTLRITVVDDETGRKVGGAGCVVETDTGDVTFPETGASGEASVTLDKDATSANIFCQVAIPGRNSTGEGIEEGSTSVTLKERGTTRATVVL